MIISVKNIQYDLDGMFGFETYSNGRTREEVLSSLPKFGILHIEDPEDQDPDGIEWTIQKLIEDETGWLVSGFDYELKGKFISWTEPKNPIIEAAMEELKEKWKNHPWDEVKYPGN